MKAQKTSLYNISFVVGLMGRSFEPALPDVKGSSLKRLLFVPFRTSRVIKLYVTAGNDFQKTFSVLPDFTNLCNTPKRAIGEKTQRHFQFQEKSYVFFQ